MLGKCTAVSQRLFCAQLVDLRRVKEAILSSALRVDKSFELSSFKCHRCTSDLLQPNVHEVIVQLGQVLNGSKHDCLGRVLMSWDSSNSPFFFFAQPDAQHPASNDHLSWRSARQKLAMALFGRPLTAKERALRVLHAQGLHAPGLFSHH